MPKEYPKYAFYLLIVAGFSLWVINWWAGRPLFIDEANVARNLYDRSFSGLFHPLDHQQYAAPLYLVMAKACGELLGYGELSLRLPAMLGGGLAALGLWLAGRTLKLGWWALLPLALLFVNPYVLRYVGEIKPYAIDLGLASLLIAFALKNPQPDGKWLLIGLLAPWISLPATFVLAAVGISSFLRVLIKPSAPRAELPQHNRRSVLKWIGLAVIWLFSFAVLYTLVIQASIGNQYLHHYHGRYFFPPLSGEANLLKALGLLYSLPKLAFGFTGIAIVVGVLLAGLGLFKKYSDQKLLLFLPLLIVTIASYFTLYSLIPRLLLFTLPGWWLLAAIGSKELWEDYSGRPVIMYGLPLSWVFVLGSTNVARHFLQPMTFSDSRDLVTQISEGYVPVIHRSVQPAWDYYRRIHPAFKDRLEEEVPATEIEQQTFPGKYVLLYTVLTQQSIRDRLETDRIWATERGCKVRTEAIYRAAAVYLDCE
ncbi:hypothetical protein [Neolewinella agarilytica]|uniref:Dolichyl-phosphate-mannose-protein mannosyltransferase n=1 Tax=Neolewinella agarilytica TaxID=478744 RepID=A0A1H9HS22_9BACT|nr:hypothetical protein [Neolewinella agarilytica]SEQ65048.1 hypothetical protein SAMN05444359_11373 [Neolewinella agarilytica]